MILLDVVGEDNRFTDIYTGWPGKVHDSRVFRNSPLYEKRPQLYTDNTHILADSAYPNLTGLLVPFRDNGHLTVAQTRYNITHAGIRRYSGTGFCLT